MDNDDHKVLSTADLGDSDHSDNESVGSSRKDGDATADSKSVRTALPADDPRRTTSKVLLSNLSSKTNEAHLREICGTFGPVAGVTLVADETSNNQKAIVEFEARTQAQDAVDFMHRMKMDEVEIFCSFTTDTDPLSAVALSAWGQPSERAGSKAPGEHKRRGRRGGKRKNGGANDSNSGEASSAAATSSPSAAAPSKGGNNRGGAPRSANRTGDRNRNASGNRDNNRGRDNYHSGSRDTYRDSYRDDRRGRDSYSRRDSYPRDGYNDQRDSYAPARDSYRPRNDYDDSYRRSDARDDYYRAPESRDAYGSRNGNGRYASPPRNRDRYNDSYRSSYAPSPSQSNTVARDDYDGRARSPSHQASSYDNSGYHGDRSPQRDYGDRTGYAPRRNYDDPPEAKRFTPYR